MGCNNSTSVAQQPNQSQSNPDQKSKSNFSAKSKNSIKSNFSRKRTQRSKKSNKITLTPQECSIQGNKENQKPQMKQSKIKTSNVKIRQIHKKLQVQDIIQLNNILTQHFFFFKLKKQQRVGFIEELKLFEIKKGKNVYEKFDKADHFYIVKEGLLEVQTENQNLPKRYLHKSDTFGELDLLFDFQRSHSVVAKQSCKLWGLQKWKMNEIKESLINQNCELTKTYLQKVLTFTYLSSDQIELISQKMFTLKYRTNQNIFLKGDNANLLFIITSGQVELQIPNKNSLIVKAGEVFGQGCLKTNPLPRIGTATSYNECRCLVISKTDFSICLGSTNIENITHFSILKWAFKRSQDFKDLQTSSFYKKIQKGKITFFKGGQNIFEGLNNFPNYYFASLQEKVNQYGVGTLVNCTLNNEDRNYIKQGDGNVFILEIKKPKLLGKSLKVVKFEEKKKFDLRIPLTHVSRQQDFKHQNLQSFLQHLILIKRIKSLDGGKGDIYHVLNKLDRKFYNMRCIKKLQISQKNMTEKLVNEKNIMMKAKMSSFLSFTHKVFHDEYHIFFIMKHYSHGNLQMLLQKHKSLTPEITVHLIACMLAGLKFIHLRLNSIHRNLSLESVFLDEEGYFGMENYENAKIVDPRQPRTHTIVGIPHYFAPQMIDGKGYSFEVDYWALGVILYRVMYGKFPFVNTTKDPFDIFKHIIKNHVEFKITSKSTPTLIQLTKQLLSSDPQARTNENGLRNHEIFMQLDWEKFERRKSIVPFNIDMFGMKKVDKKIYEEGKNYFTNFISKQRKKLQQSPSLQVVNFKSWDFQFDY